MLAGILTPSASTSASANASRGSGSSSGSAVCSAGDLIGLYFEEILQAIHGRPVSTSECNNKNTSSSSSSSSSGSSSSGMQVPNTSHEKNNSGPHSSTPGPHSSTPGPGSGPHIEWLPSDPKKASFEVLVRSCPFGAWKHHQTVMGK